MNHDDFGCLNFLSIQEFHEERELEIELAVLCSVKQEVAGIVVIVVEEGEALADRRTLLGGPLAVSFLELQLNFQALQRHVQPSHSQFRVECEQRFQLFLDVAEAEAKRRVSTRGR
jgi:hypothetical protein